MAAGVHMVLGSVMAVLGIVAPTMVAFATSALDLPFYSMNVLVALGESGGLCNDTDAARRGIPVTLGVFIVNVLVAIPWRTLTGLI